MKLPEAANQILDNLKSDLREYLKISHETLENRLKPDWFNKHYGPQNYGSYGEWLRESPYYLYDSTMWHWNTRDHLREVYKIELQRSRKKVMDFGGSIGTRALLEAAIGNEVTLVEINRPCLKYAHWRAKKYGLTDRLRIESHPIGREYDKILCIDVVGHLEQPETLKEIVRRLRLGGKLHVTWDHLLETPTHRNREFDFYSFLMKLGMEKVNDNVWKRGLPGMDYAESVWTKERITALEKIWSSPESMSEVRKFVEMCCRQDVGSVLDVGCGVGRFYRFFAERGVEYVGIDVVEEMVRRASKKHPDALFRIGSIFDIPYRDHAFDLVFAYDVLQHIDEYGMAVAELQRATKKYIALRLLEGEPRSTIGGWGEKIIFRSREEILEPFEGWNILKEYRNGPNLSLLLRWGR